MRFLSRFLLSTCAFLVLSAVAVGAWAQSAQEEPPPPEPPPRQNMVPKRNPASLSDSVRRAQRETGGQILGAERVQYDGREINRVKVIDDRGRVRYTDYDPQGRADRDRSPPGEDAPPRARGDNPRRP